MKARSIGVLLTLLATILPSHIPSAQGMHAAFELDYSGEIGPDGRVFFAIDDNLLNAGFERVNLRHAARSWRIQGLTQQVQFTNKDDWSQAGYEPASKRRLSAVESIDGDDDLIAKATIGCENNNSACKMQFEFCCGNNWNTSHEVRDSSWLDSIAVTVHEFGHWIGSRHSADRPVSDDEHFPTMHTKYYEDAPLPADAHARPCQTNSYWWKDQDGCAEGTGTAWARTVQADDINMIRAARPTSPSNILANGSFEFRDLGGVERQGWFYRQAQSGYGSATQHCPDDQEQYQPYQGNCFLQYNGGGFSGSSVYQDIYIFDGNWFNGKKLYPILPVRNRGSESETALFVARKLAPGDPVVLASKRVSILPGEWGNPGTSFTEPPDGTQVRIEIYNESGANFDVDHLRLRICDDDSDIYPC